MITHGGRILKDSSMMTHGGTILKDSCKIGQFLALCSYFHPAIIRNLSFESLSKLYRRASTLDHLDQV